MKSKKENGRVYTPTHIVNLILDKVGYFESERILDKHIIDNSCGDGAFLREIVGRYCNAYLNKNKTRNVESVKQGLEKFIHGIELDKEEHKKCIEVVEAKANDFGIYNVKWDIVRGDTLLVSDYDGKMDFVVGNPPYVRVHNLNSNYKSVKSFKFAEGGMTDLYIVFIEIGFRMLNKKGKMGLITPSSWFNSRAGRTLRTHILNKRNLVSIIDLGHYNPFTATTYTAISIFDNSIKNDLIGYFEYDGVTAPVHIDTVLLNNITVGNVFCFGSKENIDLLNRIDRHWNNCRERIQVKNGFATLADSVFIKDFCFEQGTIPVCKASKGKWTKCIFPYYRNGNPMTEEVYMNKFPEAYNHLLENKTILNGSKGKEAWFLFGRTQALRDVSKYKIAINTTVKDTKSIKLVEVKENEGLYSGLYILPGKFDMQTYRSVLFSEEFIEYIKMLKKYKSGGYYTFSSEDLAKYLTYKLSLVGEEQLTLMEGE